MPNLMRVGLASLLICGVACRPAARSETTSMGGSSDVNPAGLSAADQAAVRDLGTRFAQAATTGDVKAILAMYAPDATVLPDGGPTLNGAGVKTYWTEFAKNFSGKFELNTTSVEGRGDLAYAVGTAQITPKGAPKPMDGKWVTVQKKQPDGSWKLVVDIWNMNSPAK
jgi:uncharacterized protein (TIGR02246 family)